MIKFKKLLSLVLSVALLATSVFVGGMVVSAETVLYTTTNTYDEVSETVTLTPTTYNGEPAIQAVGQADDWWYYFGSYGATITQSPLDDEQNNVVVFDRAQYLTSLYPAAVRIYKQDSDFAHFKPNANTTYEISLKYYVGKTPSKQVNLQLRQTSSRMIQFTYDEANVLCPDLAVITETTDGWVEAKATFTTGDSVNYLGLFLTSVDNTNISDGSVSVYIDDITVSECKNVTIHNYDGVSDKVIGASATTTVADLEIPTVAGMRFLGVYADADFATKLSNDAVVPNYKDIYYKWEQLSSGQYYCGFEDYSEQLKGQSYNADILTITNGDAYIGSAAMKASLAGDGITAFEIRGKDSFEILKDTNYTVSFAYKSSADVTIGIGLGKLGNVPETSYVLSNNLVSATDSWITTELQITIDKGTVDGYALAVILVADNEATVYIDDILVTGPNQEMINMPEINFDDSWYPALNVFDGMADYTVWDGTTQTEPKDSNGDGIYEITNGAELAYAIGNGGIIGDKTACSFILTDDIYLNDITKINWITGKAIGDYTPRTWFNHETSFAGTIDGDGHIVYGLYYNDNSVTKYAAAQGVGLIPEVVSGNTVRVSNLGIENCYICFECSVSAFVGSAEGDPYVYIDKCYAGENVTLNGRNAGVFRGYTSFTYTTTITNSYSLATTIATGGNYGLAGSLGGYVTIKNSYNGNGPLLSHTTRDYRVKFENSYQSAAVMEGETGVTTLDAEQMMGASALDNMAALNSNGAFIVTKGYPTISVFVRETSEDGNVAVKVWDGSIAESFTAGSGTESDPYLITNGAELALAITTGGVDSSTLAELANFNKYYKITNDIYLNDITKINWLTGVANDGYTPNSWISYGTNFAGNIDGRGHVIYGLYFNDNSNYKYPGSDRGVGLIPEVINGNTVTVSNIGIENCYINFECGTGAFVGLGAGKFGININNSYVGSKVKLRGSYTGAFVGKLKSQSGTTTINNSYSLASVTAHTTNDSGQNYSTTGYDGAFLGTNYDYVTIKNCYNGNGALLLDTKCYGLTVSGNYQTADGYVKAGITTLTADKMMGADALTNMADLNANSAYRVATRDFADVDYYIYLPAGAVIGEDIGMSFYDTFTAAIDSGSVFENGTMKIGAYVKFDALPDESKILIPAASAHLVRQGTADEIINSSSYYDIRTQIVTDELAKQSKDAVNYLFITDIHFEGTTTSLYGAALWNQMNLVAKTANENDNIDFVVVGGDITNGTYAKATTMEWTQTILSPLADCKKPVFVLVGNHDDNCYGSNTGFDSSRVISDKTWNDIVIDPFVNRTLANGKTIEVVRGIKADGTADNYSKYYYYDFEKNGKTTRIFCLDSIDYDAVYDEVTGDIISMELADGKDESSEESMYKYKTGASYWGYSAAQIKWLAEALAETDKYDDTIFLSHMGIDGDTNSKDVYFGAELRALIKAYQNKTAFSYDDGTVTINVDYTNVSGKILSYQFGHRHRETEIYSEDIDLWQICSSTANAYRKETTNIQNWLNPDYEMNTEREACLDVMSVSNTGVYKLNIGAGETVKMVSKYDAMAGDTNLDQIVDICDLVNLNLVYRGEKSSRTTADVDKNNKLELADFASLRKFILG